MPPRTRTTEDTPPPEATPDEPTGPVVPDLTRDTLGVHARAIWDNTDALTKPLLVSMYGVDDSLSKADMVKVVVGRYLDTRPDQRTTEGDPA